MKRTLLTGLAGAALIGAAAAVAPALAALTAAVLMLGILAMRDLSLLIAATVLFNMLGEPYHLAYMSVSIGGLNLYANDVLLLVLAGVLLLKALREGRMPSLPRDRISIVVLLFLAYGLFSAVRSYPIHGAEALSAFRVRFFYALLYFLSIPALAGRRSRRRLLVALLFGAVCISLYGIHNAATGAHFGGRTSTLTYRYLSPLQALAVFFALSLLIGTWSNRRAWIGFPLVALYLPALLLAQMRSIWLGAFLGAGTVVLFASRQWRRRLLRFALPIAAAVLIFIGVGQLSGRAELAQDVAIRAASLTDTSEDVTTIWRVFVWTGALQELWQGNPVLGLGLGQRFAYFDVVRDYYEDSRQLHNTYVEYAYATGAIGVGLFILFQFLVLLTTLQAARRSRGTSREPLLLALAASQVCLAVAAFANVIGASMVSTIYVWVLGAASVVEAREVQRDPDVEERPWKPT